MKLRSWLRYQQDMLDIVLLYNQFQDFLWTSKGLVVCLKFVSSQPMTSLFVTAVFSFHSRSHFISVPRWKIQKRNVFTGINVSTPKNHRQKRKVSLCHRPLAKPGERLFLHCSDGDHRKHLGRRSWENMENSEGKNSPGSWWVFWNL